MRHPISRIRDLTNKCKCRIRMVIDGVHRNVARGVIFAIPQTHKTASHYIFIIIITINFSPESLNHLLGNVRELKIHSDKSEFLPNHLDIDMCEVEKQM